MYALEGGSIGFQIGSEATGLILLVMNDRSMESILSSKVKLGADASVAGGPTGRDASADTDAWMRAEILSYSRSRICCRYMRKYDAYLMDNLTYALYGHTQQFVFLHHQKCGWSNGRRRAHPNRLTRQHPSPKKSLGPNVATTASLPDPFTTENFTPPFWTYITLSAASL